ncbi:MAG: hypothetical protein ACAH11_03665 [Sphingomonas sp.]
MRIAALLLTVAVAGCTPPAEPVANEAGNAVNVAAPTPSPAPGPAGELSRYVGKYPFEAVDGAKFQDLPIVHKAIEDAVPDATIRKWMLAADAGPTTPIAVRDGMLISYGCEAHNCGSHNWSLILRPDGTGAQVCYDESGETGGPRWYAAGELLAKKESCPSDDGKSGFPGG